MFAVPLLQECHCCFSSSLSPTPAAEFTASSFLSLSLLQIVQWHFSGRKNSPSTGYHTPAEALSSVTERESMKSQANRVYSPFPPCVFYLFHTIMESHLRIPLFYSLHVLSWRITAHPVVLPPVVCYSWWTEWHICLASWILVSFLLQSIYEIAMIIFFSSNLLSHGACHAPHFGDISRFHKHHFVLSQVTKGQCSAQGGQSWE